MTNLEKLTSVLNRNIAAAEERYRNAKAAHGNRMPTDKVWGTAGMTVGELFSDCEREIREAKALRDWTLSLPRAQ